MSIRHSQTQQLNPINANGRHEGLALASEISKLKIENSQYFTRKYTTSLC